jgi:hypothetical protein
MRSIETIWKTPANAGEPIETCLANRGQFWPIPVIIPPGQIIKISKTCGCVNRHYLGAVRRENRCCVVRFSPPARVAKTK